MTEPTAEPPAPAHYFSSTPTSPEQRRTLTAHVWGRDLQLTSASGVFAGDSLDRGTAVLLRESSPPEGPVRVLDLGWLERVTTAAARSPDVQVMPARGLTLEEVGYPPNDELVERGRVARSVRELSAR